MRLPQSPDDASDDTINRMSEFAERPALNAETLANDRLNEIERATKVFGHDLDLARATAAAMDRVNALMPKPEIDLRRIKGSPDIRYEFVGARCGGWQCWDENSYDGGEFNILGYGPEKEDALADLIKKTAAEVGVNFDRDLDERVDDELHRETFGDERE